MMRLDKFLTMHSKLTRSELKKQITSGRVKVNDSIVKKPETHVDENADIVSVDNIPIVHKEFYYVMLNKPADVVSATTDHGTTVIDLITEDYAALLHPVGRLDKDTTGLLLLTNDGELTHRLLSPKKHVDKTYLVTLQKSLSDEDALRLESGVELDDGITLPAHVTFEDKNERTTILLTIHEGRFHQIKRMLIAVANEVTALKRISMGTLSLDPALNEGQYRELNEAELEKLLALSGLLSERKHS